MRVNLDKLDAAIARERGAMEKLKKAAAKPGVISEARAKELGQEWVDAIKALGPLTRSENLDVIVAELKILRDIASEVPEYHDSAAEGCASSEMGCPLCELLWQWERL